LKDISRLAPSGPGTGMQIRGLATERGGRHDELQDRNTYRRYNDGDYEERPTSARTHDFIRHDRSRSPRRNDGDGYRDRDRENYRSPDRSHYSRSSSPRRREYSPSYGGPPSKEVILEGLPAALMEDDVGPPLDPTQALHHDNAPCLSAL